MSTVKMTSAIKINIYTNALSLFKTEAKGFSAAKAVLEQNTEAALKMVNNIFGEDLMHAEALKDSKHAWLNHYDSGISVYFPNSNSMSKAEEVQQLARTIYSASMPRNALEHLAAEIAVNIGLATGMKFPYPAQSMVVNFSNRASAEDVFGREAVDQLYETRARVDEERLRAAKFIAKLVSVAENVVSVNQLVKLWPEAINLLSRDIKERLEEKKPKKTVKLLAKVIELDQSAMNGELAMQKIRISAGS